ncbi:MAG: DNA-directed RNA polymerase subunit beta [Actinomycetota bacterium]|nr:DNA-directed RNA polymerase subunit beta [Actinomycetota bacterium]
MSDEFHKPTQYSGDKFDEYESAEADPAQVMRVAHDTARALLHRARETQDPEVIERLVAYTDEHGIDALAELWARSSPRSLPGALWRIYLLRLLIRQDATGTAYLFQRGTDVLESADTIIAGAVAPTGPEEITQLADQILRGAFRGDFAIALDRASSFCRICAAGASSIADDSDAVNPDRATELTTRALRFTTTAEELTAAARLQRADSLD